MTIRFPPPDYPNCSITSSGTCVTCWPWLSGWRSWPTVPSGRWNFPAIIAVELDAAEEGADEIERVTRQLAQLALGVSTGLAPGKRAERLDNAAVAVLHPPAGTDRQVDLVEDGLELFSRDRQDLQVELRGLFCRMLLDGNVTVRIGEVELRVGFDQTLHLVTPEEDAAWSAPVEVSVPARATAQALKALGLSCKKIRRSATVE